MHFTDGERRMTVTRSGSSSEVAECLERFEDAATDAGATVHRTTADEAAETINEIARKPAVGVTLPFDAVQLPESVAEASHEAIRTAETGVTAAIMGIAPYGGVVVPMSSDAEGPTSLHPKRQIAVVAGSDICVDIGTVLDRLEELFLTESRDALIVAGPSTTGDMGELVTGVHGPAELFLVVIEDV